MNAKQKELCTEYSTVPMFAAWSTEYYEHWMNSLPVAERISHLTAAHCTLNGFIKSLLELEDDSE